MHWGDRAGRPTLGGHHHHFRPLGTGGTALPGPLSRASAFSGLELEEEGGCGEGRQVAWDLLGYLPRDRELKGFILGHYLFRSSCEWVG